MTELLDRLDVLETRIARLETRTAQPPASVSSQVPAPPPAAPGSETNAADLADRYRQALMLYGQGKRDDARAAFQQVFDSDPGSSLADNALFWIGETFYSTGDYHQAMRYYERVIREYASQNKAPDALFKMGMAYVKTGDLGMARRTFQECIDKYPYSSPASSSKRELRRIRY